MDSKDFNGAVRRVAWIAVVWGIIGGWGILGEWWPQFNAVTKDQITILTALVILYGRRK